MKLRELAGVGTKIYDCRRWINYRCVLVFICRCYCNKKQVTRFQEFFAKTPLRRKFLHQHPKVFAQLSRQWLFRGSRIDQRLNAAVASWQYMEKMLPEYIMEKIYVQEQNRWTLWENVIEGKKLSLDVNFLDGEIKEGCLTVSLVWDGVTIYHINFWLRDSMPDSHEMSACIGCHQGSRDGLEVNKLLTKKLYGCRPKNFVYLGFLYFLQAMGINKLSAVSNYGFYANNHFRRDRKLKVSYDEFWESCHGALSDDKRFYMLPVQEFRKAQGDLPTKKRAVYRKRYALLDEVMTAVRESVLAARCEH
ncbi:VirK/YbjX family protein [Anaerovibrio sp.]|uniref:VirK/YbjX family protein n=1 Tax=Anaerovibrio sp. TaxID=1872532 RepID=UPI003F17BFDC